MCKHLGSGPAPLGNSANISKKIFTKNKLSPQVMFINMISLESAADPFHLTPFPPLSSKFLLSFRRRVVAKVEKDLV